MSQGQPFGARSLACSLPSRSNHSPAEPEPGRDCLLAERLALDGLFLRLVFAGGMGRTSVPSNGTPNSTVTPAIYQVSGRSASESARDGPVLNLQATAI